MATYNGFSTYNRSKHFRITDFELVKQDLMNHFNIRRGEKLMDPSFGSAIWDYVFEPLDQTTTEAITQDVQKVIGYDPRIAARNVIVNQYERGLQITIDLVYIPSNQTGVLRMQFDKNSKIATQLL